MTLDFILVIFVVRYLRKSLQTATLLPAWDRILKGAMLASIGLMVVEVTVSHLKPFTMWLSHGILIYIVYILYRKKEFSSARPVMLAISPFILLSVFNDLIKIVNLRLFKTLEDILEVGIFFSIIWMIVMLIITNRQRKALEKEKRKTQQEEEQNKILGTLKEQLELQVAERTSELTLQKEALEQTLSELQSTQALLIHSEKMASLGELTAGIAHEIQNPLNFVNNFSEVSVELLNEMKAELKEGNTEDAVYITDDIIHNLEKIIHHGKRADSIVKGMLQHSRKSTGQKEPTDINALADEYLRLSFHGLRAKDKSFNAKLHTDFDKTIGKINVIPQDIDRVLLNLYNNAFYAVTQKKKLLSAAANKADGSPNEIPAGAYEPTVSVTTKKMGNKIEIRVKDNGNGIPSTSLDKIFQPFFTTKPSGEGTGLGLSLSYDIVKAHGGEIKVETLPAGGHEKEGGGAEFIISLPLQ
ncbi:MAG: histidine kinase [Chitinophagaceae bacterium]|nr:histidine kinase [Chitinophagaceae bacterium]